MLVIRLQRTGRRNLATYRIVVADKTRAVKGKFLEIVGHYLPQRDPAVLQYDETRISAWIEKGAQPSNTVARLLKRGGVKGMDPYIAPYTKRSSKAAAPVSSETAVPPAPPIAVDAAAA